jgi:hemin uptake protein HemP
MRDRSDAPPPAAPSTLSPSPSSSQRVRLVDLLRGRREIIIEHDGQDYRLRLTATDKLILTK